MTIPPSEDTLARIRLYRQTRAPRQQHDAARASTPPEEWAAVDARIRQIETDQREMRVRAAAIPELINETLRPELYLHFDVESMT